MLLYSIKKIFQQNHSIILYLLLLALIGNIHTRLAAQSESTTLNIQLDDNVINYIETDQMAEIYNIFLKGSLVKASGDLDGAINIFQVGIALDTTQARFYLEVAECKYIQDDLPSATENALTASTLDPNLPRAHLLLGTIYARQNKPQQSIGELTSALSLDSSSDDIEALLGEEYMRSGDIDNAIKHYEAAIRLNPIDVLSHFQLGNLYTQKKDYARASDHYKKVTQLTPRHALGYINLGWTLESQENDKEAESAYQQALALDPSNNFAHQRLGVIYLNRETYGKACTEFSSILSNDPNNFTAQQFMGETLYYLKNYSGAKEYLKTILSRAKNPALPQLYMGLIAEAEGKSDDALNYFDKALFSSTDSRDIYTQFYLQFARKNESKKSTQYLKKIATRHPGEWQIDFILGLNYETFDDKDNAIKFYESSITKNPDSTIKSSIYFELGSLYDQKGKMEDAISAMTSAIKSNPNNPEPYNYLGYMFADKGIRLDEAQKYVEKALELTPNAGYIVDSLGWIYYKKGKYTEALTKLQEASILTPDDPVVLDHLGDAYSKNGDTEKAIESWEKALKVRPEDKAIQNKIKQNGNQKSKKSEESQNMK